MNEIVIYCMMFIVFISFLFSIFELIFTRRFSKLFITVGMMIYKDELNILLENKLVDINKVYQFNYGKLIFISEHECLYYTTYTFFQFDFSPIKGNIVFNESWATINARLYLGMSIFLITLLVFWSVGSFKLVFFNFIIIEMYACVFICKKCPIIYFTIKYKRIIGPVL